MFCYSYGASACYILMEQPFVYILMEHQCACYCNRTLVCYILLEHQCVYILMEHRCVYIQMENQ